MKNKLILLFILIGVAKLNFAQAPLPNFNAVNLGNNKARISWVNPYPSCTQISIQKSYDSTKFFQTIFTAQSPELASNGFVDNNYLPQIKTWYRIFCVKDTSGNFFFTNSKIPNSIKVKADSGSTFKPIIIDSSEISIKDSSTNQINLIVDTNRFNIFFKNKDSLLTTLNTKEFLQFKDSINSKSKDTLVNIKGYAYILKPYIPMVIWKPSVFVYSNKKGVIEINLPFYNKFSYKLKVYNSAGKEIFKLKNLNNEKLLLEKSNFLVAGWYSFELFEDDKLKEKNKFLVEKD